MKKYLPLLAAVAFVGAGCAGDAQPAAQQPAGEQPAAQQPAAAQPAANEVFAQDFAFKPAVLKVKKGTIVKWTNKDAAQHTVTADSGKWGSELLAQNASYSYKFDNVGTFTYHCKPHPYMKGTVEVTE